MTNEKLEIFAQPLPLPENDARQIDMAKPDDYAFAFEVGLKPAFSLADLGTASLTRYKVEVTPAMIDEEVERQRTRNGKMTEPEAVASDENVLNLQFTETDADGQPVEGGITKDGQLQEFKGGIMKILERQPVPVIPMALTNLWGSYFSRVEQGGAMVRPFRRGLFNRVGLNVGAAVAPAQVEPAKLRDSVALLLAAG
jgi:hypothetical protein